MPEKHEDNLTLDARLKEKRLEIDQMKTNLKNEREVIIFLNKYTNTYLKYVNLTKTKQKQQ